MDMYLLNLFDEIDHIILSVLSYFLLFNKAVDKNKDNMCGKNVQGTESRGLPWRSNWHEKLRVRLEMSMHVDILMELLKR